MLNTTKVNGLVPMVHGNVGKSYANVYPFKIVVKCVQFITKYAEAHKLPQRYARCGHADTPPTYLPASQNFKVVHNCYVKAAMEEDPSQLIMQYRIFVDVWHKCISEVQFMTPRTDVCSV